MNRIFPVLAALALTFVMAAAVIGFIPDTSDLSNPETRRWLSVHFLTGLSASLVVMFVNGIVVTYFIGTSRWCREVVETYKLDPQLANRSAALKRRAFPIAVVNMLAIVTVVALGGASDPGAALSPQPLGSVTWPQIHLMAAMLTLAFLVYASYFQWDTIRANQAVIGKIVEQVKQIRTAKGLDT